MCYKISVSVTRRQETFISTFNPGCFECGNIPRNQLMAGEEQLRGLAEKKRATQKERHLSNHPGWNHIHMVTTSAGSATSAFISSARANAEKITLL